MITRIYNPAELIPNASLQLDKQASHHLVRVLRLKEGAEIVLFNGNGDQCTAVISDANSRQCVVEIGQCHECNNESPLNITLLQGLARSDRMDASIQKTTELGINRIIPYTSQRTSALAKGKQADKKLEHWQRVAISACEQSGRCRLPAIDSIMDFENALDALQADIKLLLQPASNISLSNIKKSGTSICILVGPESGFTEQEIENALHKGFTAITFGPRILRTETAGPAVLSAIQTLWGDMG